MVFDQMMDFYSLAKGSGVLARVPMRLRGGYRKVPFPLTTQWLEDRIGQDLLLIWPVVILAGSDLKYSLEPFDIDPREIYYEFQIHLCLDYVYHTSEIIEPFEDNQLKCSCGNPLAYWPKKSPDVFYNGRINFECPQCKARFDTSNLETNVRDGWTNELSKIKGGTTYRFAVVIDCGKCFPRDQRFWPLKIKPELNKLCQKVFNCSFYEVGDFY